jgi:hypothetical protein
MGIFNSASKFNLEYSVNHMAVAKDYFTYDDDSEDWYEAVTFYVPCPGDDLEEALIINFLKKTQSSKEFEIVMGYHSDGEWVVVEYEPFKEITDFYIGIAFNIYIETHCLSKIMHLTTKERSRLTQEHISVLEEAAEVLKVDIETAIQMLPGTPSLANSNIPKMIENVYKKYELKGMFGQDIF